LIKIDGEGMNKKGSFEKGNLYVEIDFKLPEKIKLSQKKIVRKIFNVEATDN